MKHARNGVQRITSEQEVLAPPIITHISGLKWSYSGARFATRVAASCAVFDVFVFYISGVTRRWGFCSDADSARQLSVVSSGDGRSCVVALTSQRRLYADGCELLTGCTSFVVADDFLLVTTLGHSLRCLPRAALFGRSTAGTRACTACH